MRTLVAVLFAVVLFVWAKECFTADCAGTGNGVGSLSAQKRVLFVWAKTNDDPSAFPNWANGLTTTLSDYYQVMSYDQHTVITKIATPPSDPNGGFWISSHPVAYYKNQYNPQQPGTYLGPWGIFIEEILLQIQQTKGAVYFDDVDIIMTLGTNGAEGWYYGGNPAENNTGAGMLGVDFVTANGKLFDRYDGGVYQEFGG
ncbi:hypothetical protein HUU05_10190, partial [candidate division KSB1 bacterium]|nr:hypothetical protein [candidate division KSB1 bacterium]